MLETVRRRNCQAFTLNFISSAEEAREIAGRILLLASATRFKLACNSIILWDYIPVFNIIFVMRTSILVAKLRCPSLTK